MTATAIGLYNSALKILGEPKLASITETREARYALDDVYSDVQQFCLESGQWWFARREVQLTADATSPEFGFTWRFAKPADWVRTVGLATDETFQWPLVPYSEHPSWWYANNDPIYLAYVSNGASYGLDMTKWPPTFTWYVAHELAKRTSKQITGKVFDEFLLRDWQRAKRDALNKDAMGDSQPRFLPSGMLVRSRFYNGRFSGTYRADVYWR